MRSLLAIPSNRSLWIVAVVAALIAAAGFVWMWPTEQDIQARGYGIVSLQLAFTSQRAEAILRAWGTEGRSSAWTGMLRDFVFMAGYGLLFASITLLAARTQKGLLQRAGLILTFAPLVAALLDALENILLLSVLGSVPLPSAPILVAGLSASLKFLLLALTIVYWLASAVTGMARRVSART